MGRVVSENSMIRKEVIHLMYFCFSFMLQLLWLCFTMLLASDVSSEVALKQMKRPAAASKLFKTKNKLAFGSGTNCNLG